MSITYFELDYEYRNYKVIFQSYYMPTIFCTTKLAGLFKTSDFSVPESDPSLLGDWNGHLFSIDRRKCLIFVNNKSFFCIFISDVVKKDLKDFSQFFLSRFIQQLNYEFKITNGDLARLENDFGRVTLAKTNNDKKTLGVINDLVYVLKAHCQIKYGTLAKMPVVYENGLMNEIPRFVNKGRSKIIYPKKAMLKLVQD